MIKALSIPSLDFHSFYNDEWAEHISVVEETQRALVEPFLQWVDISISALRLGKKLLFFGNGGSAADAQHLAAELTVRFTANRQALAALALTTDTSTLTAIGNDFGFECLFARQIEAIGQRGDIAIGISTSGKSPNVVRAFEMAKKKGLFTIGLMGEKGCAIPSLVDLSINIPSQITARIQEMHITLGHMFCCALENQLGLST